MKLSRRDIVKLGVATGASTLLPDFLSAVDAETQWCSNTIRTASSRTSTLRPTFLPKLLAVNPPWMRFSKSSTCAKLLAGSADLLRPSSGRVNGPEGNLSALIDF